MKQRMRSNSQCRKRTVDELITLARENPDELERYRQQQINEIITQAPPYLRKRLEGLQFEIDARREMHKTPMGACIQLSKMMHDSFMELNSLLDQLRGTKPAALGPHLPPSKAKVIPFPRNKSEQDG